MKKSILCVVMTLLSIVGSYSQSWSIDVEANNCEWTDFNKKVQVPSFDDGEKVIITASGSWTSNGETFRYNGRQHSDPRHVCEKCWAMALLIRFSDDSGTTIKEFKNRKSISHTFRGNGKIEFICNDDMNNQKHCKDNRGHVTANVKKRN